MVKINMYRLLQYLFLLTSNEFSLKHEGREFFANNSFVLKLHGQILNVSVNTDSTLFSHITDNTTTRMAYMTEPVFMNCMPNLIIFTIIRWWSLDVRSWGWYWKQAQHDMFTPCCENEDGGWCSTITLYNSRNILSQIKWEKSDHLESS